MKIALISGITGHARDYVEGMWRILQHTAHRTTFPELVAEMVEADRMILQSTQVSAVRSASMFSP